MARITVGAEYVGIPETTGTLQNLDAGSIIEVSTSNDSDSKGLLVYPHRYLSFDNAILYARSLSHNATIAVLPITAGNSGGGGGSTYVLPSATNIRLGGVKIGGGVRVENDGTISAGVAWVTGTTYKMDEFVVNDAKLYKALANHTAGIFADDLAANKWQLIGGGDTWKIAEWETAKAYDADDFAIKDNSLYLCLVAHTAGVFADDLTAGKWQLVGETTKAITQWATAASYEIGDFVINNNSLYLALSAHTAGTFADDLAAGYWRLIGPDGRGVDAWATGTSYSVGALATQSDNLYIALIAHTAGTFADDLAAGKWKLIGADNKGVPAWVTGASYAIDDVVTHSGDMYICLAAHTAGTFADDLAADKWRVIGKDGGVPAWKTGKSYAIDDIVTKDGKIYICTTANIAGTFATDLSAGYWQLVYPDKTGRVTVWETGKSYAVNDVVINGGLLYVCTAAHTATTFAADKWQLIGGGSTDGGVPIDEDSTVAFSLGCDANGVYMVIPDT